MIKTHGLKLILQIGFIKTFYFNLKYFGIKGFKIPVVIARNFKLKKMGGTVELDEKLNGKIFLGRRETHFLEGRGVWHNEGKICFHGKCIIGNGLKLIVGEKGNLELGSNIYMTGNSLIYCNSKIKIEEETIIGWNVTFIDTDQHKIIDKENNIKNISNGILIGSHVWIGTNSMILKNSIIASGSVIAAGSVICKEFNDENILIGDSNKI